MKQMKIQVLNLKKPKTQVSIGYVTLKINVWMFLFVGSKYE
jgi:hypothetical protein